jgi:hypothetical protein
MGVALRKSGDVMRMTLTSRCERPGDELVFNLLRALMFGYQLWGGRSRWLLSELSQFLHTSDARLVRVLHDLVAEGLVAMDEATGTVRLSQAGARRLLSTHID